MSNKLLPSVWPDKYILGIKNLNGPHLKKEGGNVYATCIGLDWDTPGHIPITPEILIEFLTSFLAACEMDDRLADWRAYYTSRHGTRVFYELEEPVPVEDAEKYIVTLLKEFKERGVRF